MAGGLSFRIVQDCIDSDDLDKLKVLLDNKNVQLEDKDEVTVSRDSPNQS